MPLADREVAPGAIAYFDAACLNADPKVSVSGDRVTRLGAGNQFVCYRVAGGHSWWAPLTATERPERLRIEAEWVANGYGPLGAGQVFLQDGKNTYTGPDESFVAAAVGESPFKGGRPTVSAVGVAEIFRVVKERGGQM
jgi:hypothetical protein